jgi:hypothetical protein
VRFSVARIATDPRCSVSLAQLWRDHTILDVILYLEAIDLADERERPVE